ncbi:MAG: glycosyltransferase family 4 protein [Acidobacteriota bacterium]
MNPLALDFVSPLPPVRSGISDYSVDLLPHLAALADVRVCRLPDQPVSPDVESRWRPAALDRLGEGGRVPLYQMGNNHYHSAVREAAMRVPGVLTLHDVVLHHLLLDETIGHGDWKGYRERLEAEHGWIGDAVAWGAWWGMHAASAQFALPAHQTLLRRQRGVLVHSRFAAESVRDSIPEIAVAAVPMPIPLPRALAADAGASFRARHGIPAQAFVAGSFGFQTPIKRTEIAIAALAAPALRDVHLLIAGELAEVLDFDRWARAAGVADRVHVTGYLAAEDFEASIAAADVSLNLRYPSAGETSAALLRVLALGRPAIVSDYAQFAELPESIAVGVPLADPASEAQVLASAIADLRARPERLAEMGAAARLHVAREHDPARAAQAIRDACEEFSTLRPLGDASAVEWPMTSTLAPEGRGRLEVTGASAPWAAGERRELRVRLENLGPISFLAGDRGDGGVALRAELRDVNGVDRLEGSAWVALPRDLLPGESAEVTISIRRPPGGVTLRVEPHVLGRSGLPFFWTGDATWERAI